MLCAIMKSVERIAKKSKLNFDIERFLEDLLLFSQINCAWANKDSERIKNE